MKFSVALPVYAREVLYQLVPKLNEARISLSFRAGVSHDAKCIKILMTALVVWIRSLHFFSESKHSLKGVQDSYHR